MNSCIGARLSKDQKQGYCTELTYAGKTIARHSLGSEVDLLLENGDRSDRATVQFRQAKEYQEEAGCLTLKGKVRLEEFTTDLDITVTYEAVTEHVLKKTVKLYQNDIPRLFMSLKNLLEPAVPPKSYWSFDHAEHAGGPAYGTLTEDVFPAAGFVTQDDITVGLLTDSGWENKWSRYSLRRTRFGNIPAIQLTDPALLSTATVSEREEGKHYVALTFGESYGNVSIPLENAADGSVFLGRRGFRYAIALEYRSEGRMAAELLDEGGNTVGEIRCEPDTLTGTGEWRSFVGHTEALPGNGLYTFRFRAVLNSDTSIRNVRVFENSSEVLPWQELLQGREIVRTMFIFADETETTPRNLKLISQRYLADGLGFKGTDAEKMLYADTRMLTWLAEPGVDLPVVVPSIYYFEMYFRDAFWILNGLREPELNKLVLKQIGSTMNEEGSSDNIITAFHGSIEHVDNEITYLYIIWSCMNKKRYGFLPDMEKVRRAVNFIIRTYDPKHSGVIYTNNPQSGIDVMWQDRTSRFASSQGYFALALRSAKELGVELAEEYIQTAEAAYRDYYGDYGVYGKFLHTFPDNRLGPEGTPVGMVANVDLEPEFLSLYLFDRSMLNREIVIDTLNKYPVSEEGLMPNLIRTDGTCFPKEANPFNGGFWKEGTYVNGASWLRQQYIALAVGRYYGWERAEELMKKRLEAELNFNEENPLSFEYLPRTGNPEDCPYHRVFGWNVFVLTIHEWLGRRNGGSNEYCL